MNWRSCCVLGKKKIPYELLMNYEVLRLCGHLLSLGAESGFTAISISLQQHVVSLICMQTLLCIACEFKSEDPERLQVSKAKRCHGKGCGREEQSCQHFDRVLPAVCSLLLFIQTKARLKKFRGGAFRSSALNCTKVAFVWAACRAVGVQQVGHFPYPAEVEALCYS